MKYAIKCKIDDVIYFARDNILSRYFADNFKEKEHADQYCEKLNKLNPKLNFEVHELKPDYPFQKDAERIYIKIK